eukprot:scaffold235097_cov31-Tisochrysis_lutea.AAC.2
MRVRVSDHGSLHAGFCTSWLAGLLTREPSLDRAVIESFDDMGLKEDLLRGIYSYGFEKPSAIQQRAIKPLIMMRDTIAQAQSGTGKTATFTIGEQLRFSSSHTPLRRRSQSLHLNWIAGSPHLPSQDCFRTSI